MKKNLLFSTEVYSFNNENIDNDKIKEIILKKEEGESSRSISNIGGWQSEESLLEENYFSEIKDFLFECTESVARDMYQDDDIKFYMASSWANVNRKGDYNLSHIHGNSHWSCVYYVTETYKASIYFLDPRIRAEMFTAIGGEMNPKSMLGLEKCESGQVLFFPSWLEHAVLQNPTDNPRISISSNFTHFLFGHSTKRHDDSWAW